MISKDDKNKIQKEMTLKPIPETSSVEESDTFSQIFSIDFMLRSSNQNQEDLAT